MQKLFIRGNSGFDVVLRRFDNGNCTARINLGVTKKGYTRQDGTAIADHTEWFTVVVWNRMAELCAEHIKKGTPVLVVGELRTRSYTKEDGTQATITEVIADEIEWFAKQEYKNTTEYHPYNGVDMPAKSSTNTPPSPPKKEVKINDEDDLPF